MTLQKKIQLQEVTFPDLIGEKGLFSDGDWVESKDQDPNGDVRLIQLADVGIGDYLNKSNRFMTSKKAGKLRCTYLKPGDILIARMPDPIGRACIFPGDIQPCVTVVDVCIVRPDKSLVDVNWLLHKINSPSFNHEITKWTTGTTRKRISRGNLSKISFNLPPLAEQKRIATILDKADAIRRKRQQAIQLADEFLRSVFLDMFGNVVKNSKNWKIVRFCDVCETRLGKMLDKKQQTGKHLRSYLRNANVLWDSFYIDELHEMDFNEKDRKEFRLRFGDVLICEGGEVGRSAIWRDELKECYFQKALHRVRPDITKILPEYIVHLLWFYAKNGGFQNHVTSVTIAHLTGVKYLTIYSITFLMKPLLVNRGIRLKLCYKIFAEVLKLKNMKIPLPSLKLQKQFSDIVKKLDSKRKKLAKLSSITESLFGSLTKHAFRGAL
ncbi:restriction endonuclease subunit S [Desulfobacterales bacterium HSG16]|nr:restriction endonuclease subunit S [Desulfobacterales bacterium HSG16]